jgi:hypothetical protein
MEFLVVAGVAGVLLYNSFYTVPTPKEGNKEGNVLPAPRFLYSNPEQWTSAPVDVSYRPYISFFGPNNDPRRNYLLAGGARITHSGYNPVSQTNLIWPETNPKNPSNVPAYKVQPITGTGEKQTVTSKTVFKD